MILTKRNKKDMRKYNISEKELRVAINYGEKRFLGKGYIRKLYVDLEVVHKGEQILKIKRKVLTLNI